MGFTPQALLDMPVLDARQVWYLQAFNEMSRGRGCSMAGPMPLNSGDILKYCELYYIDDIDLRASLTKFVVALDNDYLERALNKAEDDKKAEKTLPTRAP